MNVIRRDADVLSDPICNGVEIAREHRERAGDAVDRTFPPNPRGPDRVQHRLTSAKRHEIPEVERSGLEMADDLTPNQQQFLEAACWIADRFEEYQVDEEALMRRLGWESGEFSRVRNELEDA